MKLHISIKENNTDVIEKIYELKASGTGISQYIIEAIRFYMKNSRILTEEGVRQITRDEVDKYLNNFIPENNVEKLENDINDDLYEETIAALSEEI